MKIVIVGGGTAGWLTALLVKQFYPRFDITLIESEEIGILGAGEGTVPHFINVLDFLRIPVSDLIKECSATIKSGIKFTNWNGDQESYFHHFFAKDDLDLWTSDRGYNYNLLPSYLISRGESLDRLNFMSKISEQFKVPFMLIDVNDYHLKNYEDPIDSLQNLGTFALHFDARLLAKFLRKIAEQRGISRTEGKIKTFNSDKADNIVDVILENEKVIACDFIFDCSGFARLIIGKHFKSKWIDYSDHLPMNTAVPFFIPHDGKNIPAYTEAIAMKYGWIWKIPVQNRYGCGYVFDSTYINEKEALLEAEEYFNCNLTSPKSFKFSAGAFEDTLVKNCFAVGLAQNFVEPLEATSIWVFTVNLINFLKSNVINDLNEKNIYLINESCRRILEPVPEFLHFHYLTQRNDSEFWKNFRKENNTPIKLRQKLNVWNSIPLFDHDNQPLEMFKMGSWLAVGAGTKIYNKEIFKKIINDFGFEELLLKECNELDKKQNHVAKACLLHQDFIELLKNNE